MLTVVTPPRTRTRRRWLWRVPLALFVAVVVLTAALAFVLRVAFEGPALASRVCARLNDDMRGRVAIGSIEWPLASVPTVIRGGWVPVVLRDVQIRDADGIVVLRSPEIRAEIDVHAVVLGHHDVIARHVVVNGGELVLREVPERNPQFAGDAAVSLIAAFEPRAAPRAAHAARGGSRFELRDADVRQATVLVDAHAIDARVTNVSARGSLAFDPRVSSTHDVRVLPERLSFHVDAHGGTGDATVRDRRIALTSASARLHDNWPSGLFGRDSRLIVSVAAHQELEHERRLRITGLHYRVPGLEGTYDCTVDPLAASRRCDGSSSGDLQVLLRLRKLDTW